VSRDCEVVVVGAGLAGLVAAHDLLEAGVDVRVLEARERVGGRVANGTLPDGGGVVELGGEFVGPGQDALYALAASLGVETFPAYDDGERVVELCGRVRRCPGSIPRIGPLALADVGQAVWRLQRMACSVPAEAPWRARHAERRDRQSLAAWIERNVRTRRGRALIETAAETIWPVAPERVSLLHALFYLGFGDGIETLAETSGGAQQDRFVGGSHEIAARLAERLHGRIRLGSPVASLRWSDGGVTVRTGDGECTAGRALLAMSPPLWGRIRFQPRLPTERERLAAEMSQGTAIKCQAIYDRPFWRDAGLRGQAISDRGPACVTIDNSPPGGVPGVLLGLICGRAAEAASRLTERERRRAVLDCFARLFGPAAASPAGYVEQDWAAEPYSRGCYAAGFGPGGWTALGRQLRAPLGPLHWAGSETATRWYGYMEGAVASGHRAAGEVVASAVSAATTARPI
jgi:monoamine oxidase